MAAEGERSGDIMETAAEEREVNYNREILRVLEDIRRLLVKLK